MNTKKKKTLASVFLFFCLLFSLSCLASAGWQMENGATYYYTNGKKAVGIKTIKNKKYLFDSSGKLITNQVTKYRGKLYVSQKTGILLTSWGKYNGKSYYGTSSGALKSGLCKYKNNYYYFD